MQVPDPPKSCDSCGRGPGVALVLARLGTTHAETSIVRLMGLPGDARLVEVPVFRWLCYRCLQDDIEPW